MSVKLNATESCSPQAIVWLHLSCFHFCKPKTGWDAHRVLNPLIDDLQKMEKDYQLTPQIIFFTGDAAEWEYACRAGTSSAYSYGSDCTEPAGKDPFLDKLGWYYENSNQQTHPVSVSPQVSEQ